jgi:hypothetical protein
MPTCVEEHGASHHIWKTSAIPRSHDGRSASVPDELPVIDIRSLCGIPCHDSDGP